MKQRTPKVGFPKARTPKERKRHARSGIEFDRGVSCVRAAFALADNIDLFEGRLAYIRYNVLMRRLAHLYGCSLEQATAVFCATSPNNDYANNLRSTVSVLDAHKKGIPLERVVISTYNHCKERAWSYLEGVDFLDVTRGPKIRSFYSNIIDPQDRVPVTVDGHMIGIWHGKRITMKEAVRYKFQYEMVAEAVRMLAERHSLIPNQLQAVLWFTWKRVHRVVYSAQMELLNQKDHWRVMRDPGSIRPFRVLPQGKKQDEWKGRFDNLGEKVAPAERWLYER